MIADADADGVEAELLLLLLLLLLLSGNDGVGEESGGVVEVVLLTTPAESFARIVGCGGSCGEAEAVGMLILTDGGRVVGIDDVTGVFPLIILLISFDFGRFCLPSAAAAPAV